MDRPKVVELLAERTGRIEQALRDLEGQMNSLNERIQALSEKLDSIAQESGAPTDVGSD
jgi:chaperonin cofactor prefoldin